jgi:hypothetical protein
MPIDNIPINTTAPQAQQLRSLCQMLWNSQALAQQILLQMQQQTDFSSYVNIETQFGLPTGKGVTVYGLIFALANGSLGTGSNATGVFNSAIAAALAQLN